MNPADVNKMVANKPENKTEMVNAPATSDKLAGKDEQKKTAGSVRIKTLRPIALTDGRTIGEGVEVEVDELTAQEFCDRKFVGTFSFSGERSSDDAERRISVRAVRVAKAA